MSRASTLALALAAAFVAAPAARGDEAADLVRLRAEGEKLRAELAACQGQVHQLRAELADAKATREQLQAELDQLRKQMEHMQARLEAALREAHAGRGPGDRPGPAAETGAGAEPSHALDIRVEAGGWGDAGPADIRAVLLSAAGELWKHFPQRRLPPIIVRHSAQGPMTLYERGPGGEYVILLNVKGTYWCQFAYQFAHEFCHVLTNYEKRSSSKNQWFEESLAEAASVYAVQQMGETWKTKPPYPNWKAYAASLSKYAADVRAKDSDELRPGEDLAGWHRRNEAALQADPYDRRKNRLAARQLLTLLEEGPASWEAVGCLNLSPADAAGSFRSCLAAWRRDAPDRHKAFVAKVAELLGVELGG